MQRYLIPFGKLRPLHTLAFMNATECHQTPHGHLLTTNKILKCFNIWAALNESNVSAEREHHP